MWWDMQHATSKIQKTKGVSRDSFKASSSVQFLFVHGIVTLYFLFSQQCARYMKPFFVLIIYMALKIRIFLVKAVVAFRIRWMIYLQKSCKKTVCSMSDFMSVFDLSSDLHSIGWGGCQWQILLHLKWEDSWYNFVLKDRSQLSALAKLYTSKC